ncbi:MAG: ABC transporter permease [Micromonosporaceae bacterium]
MTEEPKPDAVPGEPADPAGAGATVTEERPEPPGTSFSQALFDALTTANAGTVTVLAVVLALLVGSPIIIASDEDVLASFSYFFSRPTDTLYAIVDAVGGAYGALFKGSIVDFEVLGQVLAGEAPWDRAAYPLSETLTNAAPLILTGLAVTLAFRAGMFNIGGEGQAVIGAIGAGLAGFMLHLPPVLHLIVALVAGASAGALYGFVPGWLKARTGAHEVITTIMLNYIAGKLLVWLVVQDAIQQPGRQDAISRAVDGNALLPPLAGDLLRVNLGIVLAIVAAFAVAWVLQRSTLGFELRAVGSNPHAARTAGMSVGKTYVLVMMMSGALGGLGGASLLLGPAHALTPAVIGGIGFDGITVALLGRGTPLGTVLAGLLFGALRAGAVRMQGEADIPVDMVTILQALIVMFIAAPALVKSLFRLREERAAGLGQALAKGW